MRCLSKGPAVLLALKQRCADGIGGRNKGTEVSNAILKSAEPLGRIERIIQAGCLASEV